MAAEHESEMQPLQTVTSNLHHLTTIELKRIMLQASTVRVTRSVKKHDGGHPAMTTPDSDLLRSLISYLPELTAIELEKVEERATQLLTTMPLQQQDHPQTENISNDNDSTPVPSNVVCRATPQRLVEAGSGNAVYSTH